MTHIKTIVAATDLSPLSQYAVRHACELAAQFQAHLHLVHAVSYPFAGFAEECRKDYGKSIDECEREYFEAAQGTLANVDVAPLDESSVTRAAIKGFPLEEVANYTTDCRAELLILGTHGFTGLQHVLLGSTAEALIRAAPCPVLTVRDPGRQYVPHGKIDTTAGEVSTPPEKGKS